MVGSCPVHSRRELLQRHHILPRRFFGKQKGTREILHLCASAHRDLEKVLEYFERLSSGCGERVQLSPDMYRQMAKMFVEGHYEQLLLILKGEVKDERFDL